MSAAMTVQIEPKPLIVQQVNTLDEATLNPAERCISCNVMTECGLRRTNELRNAPAAHAHRQVRQLKCNQTSWIQMSHCSVPQSLYLLSVFVAAAAEANAFSAAMQSAAVS